jgi:CRISPR/Cas system endoribonuclease Cas6 (RAMP superfamily)
MAVQRWQPRTHINADGGGAVARVEVGILAAVEQAGADREGRGFLGWIQGRVCGNNEQRSECLSERAMRPSFSLRWDR